MATKIVLRSGRAVGVYDDRLLPIYRALGSVSIERASEVEWVNGQWVAIERSSGRKIAAGQNRAEVIRAEVQFLEGRI